MKETITNTKARVYHFSFCSRGRVVTVMVPPGAVTVKENHLIELQKIDMFNALEADGVLVVGGIKEAPEAKTKATKEKPKAKAEPKAKADKVEPKTESANMDLEEL